MNSGRNWGSQREAGALRVSAPLAASPGGGAREGQTFGGASLLARYASFVKLPHTLFALPFAGLGATLASRVPGVRVTMADALWIVLAFTAARFAAMGFNRIADREFDARNPRTQRRELPAGRLSVAQAWISVAVACLVFIAVSFRLNPLCGFLAPIALLWVFFYSYTKRFTQWAHPVLGLALGIAPVGGYLALAGAWSSPWYALLVLAAAVMFWVAGFDVIYSIQDIDFDRAAGLHSIAARYGAAKAVLMARLFHGVAVILFFLIWAMQLFPVGSLYLAGVAGAALLLFYENWSVRSAATGGLDLKKVDLAFFRTNIAVSLGLFALTLADRLFA
jgi:4-hydroxybenzoate polyprenyltransferase